jgi:hypothetical protein
MQLNLDQHMAQSAFRLALVSSYFADEREEQLP